MSINSEIPEDFDEEYLRFLNLMTILHLVIYLITYNIFYQFLWATEFSS